MNYALHDFLKKPFHSHNPHELSYSLLTNFHECERKFEINQLLVSHVPVPVEERSYFQRGTAYGAGVQAYLLTGDMDFSLLVCWLAYEPEVEDLHRVPTISVARTINNLLLSKDKLDAIRQRYTVAFFNGKPAVELAFKLHIVEPWYYIGHVDLVLFDTILGIYVVLEIKTTVYKMADLRPLYQNSGQGLGYSIVIDQIVGKDQNQYGVLYLVCRDKNNSDFIPDIEVFSFNKTIIDRLRWFYTLQMDVDRMNTMSKLGVFPLRGHSCTKFGKTCSHFGFCTLTAGDSPRSIEQDNRVYDFEFHLNNVISDHLGRLDGQHGKNVESSIQHVA